MQQHDESREAWIRRHTWGATAMDQDEQPERPPEDSQAASLAPGEMDDQQEDEAPPASTSLPPPPTSPSPRIVEGTLVESMLLVALPPQPSAQVASDSPPVHTLLRWVGQSLTAVLVALLTVLALTPTQAPLMRRFVSLVPAAGATATVTLITDQAVVVPAAHLPAQGQASVAAHALTTGPQGNIAADDLNELCCFVGIAVQNTQAFVGGQNARDFQAVGARDASGAATPLIATLTGQGQTAAQAQVRANEQLVPLVHPVQCATQVTATPAIGAEATQVTVTVQVTCRAEVYRADQVQAQIADLLSRSANTRLGSAYLLLGKVTPIVNTITTLDARQGVVSMHIQAEGTWAYHLSAAQLHRLVALVAGTLLHEARTTLLHTQGIHQVSIATNDWWDDAGQQALPSDPNRIQVVVISWIGV